MGVLTGAQSSGGSVNSASSYSNTYGTAATAAATAAASNANSSAMDAWREAAAFNAKQAAIQREWQEKMANTTYQRTMADMKAAGVNPILAAQMGLSADSVGSGATATMSTPNTYMANTFADQNSASTSNGNSWEQSTSGLATALEQMGNLITGLIGGLNSSTTVNVALENLGQLTGNGQEKMTNWKDYKTTVEQNNKKEIEKLPNVLGNLIGKMSNAQKKAAYGK